MAFCCIDDSHSAAKIEGCGLEGEVISTFGLTINNLSTFSRARLYAPKKRLINAYNVHV